MSTSGSALTLRLSGRATPVPRRAIGAALESAEADPEVRALLLADCTESDLGNLVTEADRDDARTAAYLRLFAGRAPLPVVGTATGIFSGSGLELFLGCNVIVASTAARSSCPQLCQGVIRVQGGSPSGRTGIDGCRTGTAADPRLGRRAARPRTRPRQPRRIARRRGVDGVHAGRGSRRFRPRTCRRQRSRTPRRHRPFTGVGPARGLAREWGPLLSGPRFTSELWSSFQAGIRFPI